MYIIRAALTASYVIFFFFFFIKYFSFSHDLHILFVLVLRHVQHYVIELRGRGQMIDSRAMMTFSRAIFMNIKRINHQPSPTLGGRGSNEDLWREVAQPNGDAISLMNIGRVRHCWRGYCDVFRNEE
jgi:hypothetical protein